MKLRIKRFFPQIKNTPRRTCPFVYILFNDTILPRAEIWVKVHFCPFRIHAESTQNPRRIHSKSGRKKEIHFCIVEHEKKTKISPNANR